MEEARGDPTGAPCFYPSSRGLPTALIRAPAIARCTIGFFRRAGCPSPPARGSLPAASPAGGRAGGPGLRSEAGKRTPGAAPSAPPTPLGPPRGCIGTGRGRTPGRVGAGIPRKPRGSGGRRWGEGQQSRAGPGRGRHRRSSDFLNNKRIFLFLKQKYRFRLDNSRISLNEASPYFPVLIGCIINSPDPTLSFQ